MRKKCLVIICVAAVLISGIVVFVVLFGCQTAIVLLIRKSKAECPVLYEAPRKLDLEDRVFTNGTTLSYFEYEFEVPWSNIGKEDKRETSVRVLFESGKGVAIISPETDINIVQGLRGDDPEKAKLLSILLGRELLESNHSFYNTVLRVTPNDISIFRPRNQVIRAAILLCFKRALSINGESGLFEFESHGFRGFQFGSPSISDKVILNIFDNDDRHLEILVFVAPKRQAKLSQEEINHIILTLRASSEGIN